MNGYECEFCHYEHDKRKRKNKTKKRADAAFLRFAPRATAHAAPVPYGGAAPQRSLVYQPPLGTSQTMAGFSCGSVAPSMGSVLTPSLSLMGHRAPESSVAYAAAPLLMPVQHQPCLQQYVVCGGGSESSAAAPVQGFGRHVIQLPPAVSEQAWTTSGISQELDFELSPPPPPPPVCPPHFPSQQHCAVPPSLPPSASPRLATREAAM